MQRYSFILMLIIVTVLGQTTVSEAMDGKRKGFIVGFGAGAGLATYQPQRELFEFTAAGPRESKLALMTDFKLGYAPSDQVAIFWMAKVAWFGSDLLTDDSALTINGVGGVAVAYYLQPAGPAPYFSLGYGFSSWGTPFEVGSPSYYGSGIALGAGYEFSKHWSVEGNITFGSPDDDTGSSIGTRAFRLTINVLGY